MEQATTLGAERIAESSYREKPLYIVDAPGYPANVLNFYRDRQSWVGNEFIVGGQQIDAESMKLMELIGRVVPYDQALLPIAAIGTDNGSQVWGYASRKVSEYITTDANLLGVRINFIYQTGMFPDGDDDIKAGFLTDLVLGKKPGSTDSQPAPNFVLNTAGNNFDPILELLMQKLDCEIERVLINRSHWFL